MSFQRLGKLVDAAKEGAMATPPVAASFWTLDNIVIMATLFYLTLMSARIIYQWTHEIKDKRKDNDDEEDEE